MQKIADFLKSISLSNIRKILSLEKKNGDTSKSDEQDFSDSLLKTLERQRSLIAFHEHISKI